MSQVTTQNRRRIYTKTNTCRSRQYEQVGVDSAKVGQSQDGER